jgi:hypothetical protein
MGYLQSFEDAPARVPQFKPLFAEWQQHFSWMADGRERTSNA